MLSPIEQFLLGKFNFKIEIGPAILNRQVEEAMVDKLIANSDNIFSRIELEDAVFNLVHISQHYICDAPWLFNTKLQ